MPRRLHWQRLRRSVDAEHVVHAARAVAAAHEVGERAVLAPRPIRQTRLALPRVLAHRRLFESIAIPVACPRQQQCVERVAGAVALRAVRSRYLPDDQHVVLAHLARPASVSLRTLDRRCRSHPPVRDHQNFQRRNHACHSSLVNGRGSNNGWNHGLSRRDFEQLII